MFRTRVGAAAGIVNLLREENQPGTDGEHGKPTFDLLFHWREETEVLQQLALHGRFAARERQQIHVALQIRALPDLECLRALCAPVRRHLRKRTLNR